MVYRRKADESASFRRFRPHQSVLFRSASSRPVTARTSLFVPVVLVVPIVVVEASCAGGLVRLAGIDDVTTAVADEVRRLYPDNLHGRFRVCSFHLYFFNIMFRSLLRREIFQIVQIYQIFLSSYLSDL